MFRFPIRSDLELRLCVHGHADPAFALIEKNREHLARWLPWVELTHSPADVRGWIQRGLEQLQRNEGWQAGIWYQERLAGFIGFKPIDWPNRRGELGYWLGAEFEGKGLMTASARAATDYAFREWELHRIEIRCAVNNHRSAAIPRRLGFVEEGVLREAFRVGTAYQDVILFARLRRDWLQQSPDNAGT